MAQTEPLPIFDQPPRFTIPRIVGPAHALPVRVGTRSAALAHSRRAEFGDDDTLLKLTYRPEDLANECPRRVVITGSDASARVVMLP